MFSAEREINTDRIRISIPNPIKRFFSEVVFPVPKEIPTSFDQQMSVLRDLYGELDEARRSSDSQAQQTQQRIQSSINEVWRKAFSHEK